MKKIFFIIIAIIASANSNSQTSFILNIGNPSFNETPTSIIQNEDSTYNLLYGYSDSSSVKNVIVKIGSNGQIEKTKTINLSNRFYLQLLKFNNRTLLFGASNNNNSNDSIVISELDSNWNIRTLKTFFINNSSTLLNFHIINNKDTSLTISGYSMKSFISSPINILFGIILDSSLNIKTQNLDIESDYNYISPILYNETDSFFYSFVEKNNLSYLFRYDTNLQIDSIFLNNPLGNYKNPFSFIKHNNHFVLSSRLKNERIQVTKLDATLNNLKMIYLGDTITEKYPTALNNLVLSGNDTYCAYTDSILYSNPYWGQAMSIIKVMKLDSNLNTIWASTFRLKNRYIFAYNISSTFDGGCILIGTTYNYLINDLQKDLFVVKFDSLGNPTWRKKIAIEKEFIKLYPNPANDFINLELQSQSAKIESIKILNYQGKTLLIQKVNSNKSKIDINNLNSGVYFIEAITNSGEKVVEKFVKE